MAEAETKKEAPAMAPLRDPKSPEMNQTAPETFDVKFETTKGDFVVQVTRAWAPLGADRFYMLIDGDEKIGVETSVANTGFMTMSNGLSRLDVRFFAESGAAQKVLARGAEGLIPSEEAEQLGIATIAADDIDFEDELRIAIEERASLSPDALTGMEANLRFAGPETMETKIFGRLSAWQNWIFQRPNAVGEKGALTLYGKSERARFNWTRT